MPKDNGGVIFLSYTMARNYLLDVIIPIVSKFNPVAGLILALMERRTVGYHRDTVRLSIQDMMNFTSASESTVRRSRNYLIRKGYIEVIENGTGLNKSHLRLNLFPDENPVPPPNNIINLPDPPASNAPTSEDQQSPPNRPPMENLTDHVAGDEGTDPPLTSQTEHETASQSPSTMTSQDRPPSIEVREVDPVPPEIPPEIPSENAAPPAENQNQSNENPEKSSPVTQTTPPERSPLAQDPKETNMEPAEKSPDGDLAKKTVGFVLCFFRYLGAELGDSEYKFVWWAVKFYGIDAMVKQIEVMRQQSKRGVKFINPIGRLRSGLTKRYEYCKTDRDVWKAKEKRERQRQREEEESRQYRSKLDDVRKEMENPEVQKRMQIRFAEARRALGITS